MKKLIVCLIMVCVIISMTACGSEKNEATNTTEIVATSTSDEVEVTESTEVENIGETETTVIETEPQESTSNKNEGNNQNTNNSGSGNGTTKPNNSNTNNDKTENQKPSSKPSSGGNTTSKPTSKPNSSTTKPTVKPTTPTTKPTSKPTSKPTPKPTTPATKPTTKPTTPTVKPTTPEKPYFVSLEYVSETRPNTFYVDGMDVLTRVYGKAHYAYQTGDTVTYRVNMSDGGNKGFEIESTFGCNAKISGKNIIITINGTASTASVKLNVNTKNGSEIKRIGTFRTYVAAGSNPLSDYYSDLVRTYAENIGLTWVNGYTNSNGEFRTVPLNNMFNTMDELKNMGCTKFNYQIGSTGFQIIAGN